MSLGDFLNEEQNKKDEAAQALEQHKAEFFTACSSLVNQIRTWLMIETARGQVEILQPQGLGNVYGKPPITQLKTSLGVVTFAPDDRLYFGARGVVRVSSGNKAKELILKDQWYIRDEVSGYSMPGMKRQALEDYLILDEHTFADMMKALLKN